MTVRSSLRSLFTLPLVVLVLLSTAWAGVLSYRSAVQVADDNVARWLVSGVRSIGQQLDSQRALVDASLTAALAEGAAWPDSLADDLEGLRQQLWAAARLHPDDRAELRVVTSTGQAATLTRLAAQQAELRVQESPTQAEARFWFDGADGVLQSRSPGAGADGMEPPAAPASGPGDPRAQAWVRQAFAQALPQWLPTETDASGTALQSVRVRSVRDNTGAATAALATPVSLADIHALLRRMPLPTGGEAVIVERDGLLVASSAGPLWRRTGPQGLQRLSVSDASLPLMSRIYPALQPRLGQHAIDAPGSATLRLEGLSPVVASWARLADGVGRDWVIVVATPRDSLTQPLMRTTLQTLALGLAAGALVLLLAAWAQRRLSRDSDGLVDALRRMGEGDLDTPVPTVASPELDSVHTELQRLQGRLRAERHTGLVTREALLRRAHERIRAARRHNDSPLLALLYIDLDRFADINARLGQDAGDRVLLAIGLRLRQTVRGTDLVTRWAGDEFVVLLDGVLDAASAERVRDQVERVLRDPVELGPGVEAAEPAGSVGLAIAPEHADHPQALVDHARQDMLERKRAGLTGP